MGTRQSKSRENTANSEGKVSPNQSLEHADETVGILKAKDKIYRMQEDYFHDVYHILGV